jgi:hypothetical protein
MVGDLVRPARGCDVDLDHHQIGDLAVVKRQALHVLVVDGDVGALREVPGQRCQAKGREQ